MTTTPAPPDPDHTHLPADTAAATSSDPDHAHPCADLRVHAGHPTPEELAALTVVLSILTQPDSPTTHPDDRAPHHADARPPSWTDQPTGAAWTAPTSAAPAPSWRNVTAT